MYFCLWVFWTIGDNFFSFLAKILGKVQKFVFYVSMGTIYEESCFWRNGFFCMIFGHEAKITQISFETPHEGCHNCILRLHRCFFRKIEVFSSWFFHRFWISDYFFWALAKKSSGGDDETAFKMSLGTFWWKVIGLAFFSHREQKNQLVEKLFWHVCQNCIIRVRGVILGEHVCFETKFFFSLFRTCEKTLGLRAKIIRWRCQKYILRVHRTFLSFFKL